MENPGNHVMYYLKDGPERAFVSEELKSFREKSVWGFYNEWNRIYHTLQLEILSSRVSH